MGLDHGLWIKKKRQKDAEFEPLAIWRKNNAMHHYICANIAKDYEINCKNIRMSKPQLKDLYLRTNKVLDSTDIELAKLILPTMDGFFFGNTDYNEIYFEQIKQANQDLKKVLDEVNFKENSVYYHSWY